jgi:hypothetical protein
MLSRIRKENQNIYINNEKVLGVQSFNASYAAPIEQVKSLGMDTVTYYNNQNTLAEINISKLLIDKDEFVKFLDYEQGFSGHIDYKNKYFAFNSGILTRYNLSCAVGEIPQVTLDISAIGDFGYNTEKANSDSLTTPDIDITDYSNIQINLDDFNFNRLQSFTLNISAEKNIIYALGSAYPKQIKVIPPILAEIEFSIKADDYSLKNIRDLICKYKVDNFQIIFNKFKNPEEELFRFDFSEALFIGESFGGSTEASADVKIKYHAFIYDKRTIPESTPLPQVLSNNESSSQENLNESVQLPTGDTSNSFSNTESVITSRTELFKGDVHKSKPSGENNILIISGLKDGDTKNATSNKEDNILGQNDLFYGETSIQKPNTENQIFTNSQLNGMYQANYIFPPQEQSIFITGSLPTGDGGLLFPSGENSITEKDILPSGDVSKDLPNKEDGIAKHFGLLGKNEANYIFPPQEQSIFITGSLPTGDGGLLFPSGESLILGSEKLSNIGINNNFSNKETAIIESDALRGTVAGDIYKFIPTGESEIGESSKIPKDPKD